MSALRGWLLPLSGAFASGALGSLLVFSSMPGCQTRCLNSSDCGDQSACLGGRCETQCFADDDCLHPPECQGNRRACKPKGLRCNSLGLCVGNPGVRPAVDYGQFTPPEVQTDIQGWLDTPGSGRAFIIDSLAIAPQDRGFDIDGKCRGPGDCIDNSLWQLGQLGNDQIRQGLLGGETLLLVELAGLDEPFRGQDRSVTVKFYGARDADDPFFPANNFAVPPGDQTCCEFKINPQSIAGIPPQARARAPAKIERGQLRSLAPVPVQFTLTVGVPPHPEIRVDRVLLSARVPTNLSRIEEGLLGGAVPISTLAQTENPYCKTLNNLCQRQLPDSTLIDLIAAILQPDIDLGVPPDGLETLVGGADGRIAECFDGCTGGGGCQGTKLAPTNPMQPWSCALNSEMEDGYSVGIVFTGVAATVVAIGQ